MKRTLKVFAILVGILLLLLSWPAYQFYQEIDKSRSEDPLVWEQDIAALENATAGLHPPGEGIVFVGSSSIRLWDSLAQDMAPLPVIQHGFGGAKLGDVVHYADRLVSAHQPRAVVIFAGTNDITPEHAKLPEVLLASYQAFVGRVRAVQPELPILFIAITPSPLRWSVWPIAQEANALVSQYSATDPNLYVVDTAPVLLGEGGEPRDDLYIFDGLHLSEAGYAAWTATIRPALEAMLAATDGPVSD